MFNGKSLTVIINSLIPYSSFQTIPVRFFARAADSKAHKSLTTKCTTCTLKSNTSTWRSRTFVDICAFKASNFSAFLVYCGNNLMELPLTSHRPHGRTSYTNHLFRGRNHWHKTYICDQERNLGRQRKNRYATLGPVRGMEAPRQTSQEG